VKRNCLRIHSSSDRDGEVIGSGGIEIGAVKFGNASPVKLLVEAFFTADNRAAIDS
jgi:hypothetical protein